MKDKDREIRVGKNRFHLGEDNIIYVTWVGETDKEIVIACRDALFKLSSMVEGKAHRLVDLNKARKPSAEAREIGIKTFKHEKTGKIAFYGLHPMARVIASFLIGITKKKDIRFFKTKEKALAWLKK